MHSQIPRSPIHPSTRDIKPSLASLGDSFHASLSFCNAVLLSKSRIRNPPLDRSRFMEFVNVNG